MKGYYQKSEKKQPIQCKKIFANCITDKGPEYKEVLQLNNRKSNF